MRVEVVHTQAEAGEHGWHWARIKGDNGEIVWVTEQYGEARTAREAIALLAAGFGVGVVGGAEGAVEAPEIEIVDVWE